METLKFILDKKFMGTLKHVCEDSINGEIGY